MWGFGLPKPSTSVEIGGQIIHSESEGLASSAMMPPSYARFSDYESSAATASVPGDIPSSAVVSPSFAYHPAVHPQQRPYPQRYGDRPPIAHNNQNPRYSRASRNSFPHTTHLQGYPASGNGYLPPAITGGVIPINDHTSSRHNRNNQQQLSHVLSANGNPEEVQVHLWIPGHMAGVLIGKGGEQLRAIKEASGCREVIMTPRVVHDAERRLVLAGKLEHILIGQKIALDHIRKGYEPPSETTPSANEVNDLAAGDDDATDVTTSTSPSSKDSNVGVDIRIIFWLRREVCGAVIGSGGSTIKGIKEKTGAKVYLAKEEIRGHRNCTISGPSDTVTETMKLIYDIVRTIEVQSYVEQSSSSKRLAPPSPIGKGDRSAKKIRLGDQGSPDESQTTTFLIPESCAGLVIGKGGAGLRQIRETYHVNVQVQDAEFEPGYKAVILLGEKNRRMDALQAILINAHSSKGRDFVVDYKMIFPNELAGRMIGKGGEKLKKIRDISGIKSVSVEREARNGCRILNATGPLDGVLKAACEALAVEAQLYD